MTLATTFRSLTAPLRPRKGDATRAAIVEAALAIARRDGLEGLTIGALADALAMSKSGVFAHFGSREDLQLAVLNEYAARFVDDVLRPAVAAARGLPRLRALLENWLALLGRELQQGCLLIAGASEYDDRVGPLHDAMVRIVTGWKRELLHAIELARAEGHLDRKLDPDQLVFEIYGLMLVAHQDARLLHSKDSLKRARTALARMLDTYGTAAGKRSLAARAAPKPRTVGRAEGARSPQLNSGRSPGLRTPALDDKRGTRLSTKAQRVRAAGSRTRAAKAT
ncbi:MAG: TetR/AcrR family transcriptional regulator [Burkholderiaceae bacterium]|nr:TetR/AcrR family transcriptional regulator [Burkholderiaceae bacterium]